MNKSLLLLFGTITIIAAVMVGAPFVTGMMAEKQYHAMIRANPFKPTLQLESRNFDRGFFSSRATTFIEINDPALREILAGRLERDANGKIGIPVHHRLNHGPLIFGDGHGIVFAIADVTHRIEQNGSDQKSGDVDLFQLDTRLHFDGSQSIEITSREISTRSDRAATTLLPLSASFITDKNYRTFKGDGNWKGMVWENGQGEKVSISDSQFELDTEKSGEMWLGNISLSQSSITLESPGATLRMDGLKVESGSSGHGAVRLIDFTAQMSLQQVKTAGKLFGPGELSLAINNIPATALERLNAIQQRAMNASSSNGAFALQAAGFEALGLLPELLSHGIVIDMKRLYFNTPDGEIIGHFKLMLPKSNPSSLLNIPYLKSIMELDAGFSLPIALIPETMMSNQVRPLLERGYLKMDGEILTSEIRMSAGVATMNDKVVPLPY